MRQACGLDVHKDSIYMCILYENGLKIDSVFGAYYQKTGFRPTI